MGDLRLAVKREYFEQIKSGEKLFENRLFNDYWCKRLLKRDYDTVTITLGYPPKGDTERTLVFPYRGWFARVIIHKHFGTEPVKVFSIHVGEQPQ